MSSEHPVIREYAAKRFPGASLLLAAVAVAIFLFPSLGVEVDFDRVGIANGEWWRLLTGHLAHWSLDHILWDLAVFVVLGVICERISGWTTAIMTTVSALAISAAVWFWLPEMDLYRGLSGIDSTLFTFLAGYYLLKWREDSWMATIAGMLLLLFAGKIGYEMATAQTVFVNADEAGMVPVPLAHVVGGVVGILGALWNRIPRFALRPAVPVPDTGCR